MNYELAPFRMISLDEPLLEMLIDEHESITLPRFQRLWAYYRNALAEPTREGGSQDAPFQKAGLPARLTNSSKVLLSVAQNQREIVIENDIAWRIHTLVDFMFPAAPKIISQVGAGKKRGAIESILDAVLEANGGIGLFQNAALLGSVYGHVDFLLNTSELSRRAHRGRGRDGVRGRDASGGESSGVAPSQSSPGELLSQVGSLIGIETVEAPRAIPLLDNADYRNLGAYIIHYQQPVNGVRQTSLFRKLAQAMIQRHTPSTQRDSVTITEIHSATHFQRYENMKLVEESVNRLGRIPVVHIQNLNQPFSYQGLSDVEPLIPLQDELNTRLSDRANRVTMQSFRMWLGKGIDGFTDRTIGPGQMWMTDNLDASIEGFGGDADSPSERAHLEDLREALDKASGVTPAAAGHIKARVGNLTSENALRISLMGTVAKVKRKRVTYGAGIRNLCELILHALDVHGIYRTTPEERRVDVIWTDPISVDESRRIADALAKAELGIPRNILRTELGYPDSPGNESPGNESPENDSPEPDVAA